MANISIGDAVGEGFALIRRQPLVVAAWGLIGLAISWASLSLYGAFYIDLIGNAMRSGGANPAASPEMLARMQAMQGPQWLLTLLSLIAQCVIYCAVFRAVIHPERSRFAYLRLGAAELFTVVLLIAGYIGLFLAMLIPALVIAAIVAGLTAAHATVAAAIVGVLAVLALIFGLIYVLLRLSLIGPMMVADDRFHFGDAWALTRRHAGALLAIGLLVFLILLIGEIIMAAIFLTAGVSYLSSAAGGLSHLQDYFKKPPGEILSAATPLLLIVGLVWVPLTGCVFAIMGAPWARAYRDLAGPDIASTFA